MLFVFPQGRISASKALQHKYFSEFLVLDEKLEIPLIPSENNMKFMQNNLADYKFFFFLYHYWY